MTYNQYNTANTYDSPIIKKRCIPLLHDGIYIIHALEMHKLRMVINLITEA